MYKKSMLQITKLTRARLRIGVIVIEAAYRNAPQVVLLPQFAVLGLHRLRQSTAGILGARGMAAFQPSLIILPRALMCEGHVHKLP